MVSVLVPVYNAEKTIVRCLDSILGQTYQNIEVIIVNDGSKDNTLSILEDYSEKDSRIRLYDEQNGGVAAARNIALRNAQGEYILYVDSDDWLELNAIECLLGEMRKDVDIVFCSSDHAEKPEEVHFENRKVIEEWNHDQQIYEFLLHRRMSGMLWNKLIRRSLTEGIGFNEKTGYGEDAEFLWEILEKSKNMLVTNEVLYHHVLEETSISHLTYSEKKYSAIPMWEKINEDVKRKYPQLMALAKVSLTSAAVYGMYEAHQGGYSNKDHISHMRSIARKNLIDFIKAKHISLKFKLYALAVCVGY